MTTFLADLLAKLRPARMEAALTEAALVEQTITVVDEVLEALGLGDTRDEAEEGVAWRFQVGSAQIEIGIHDNEILDEPTIEICAPILTLPSTRVLAFYRRCLELNRLMVGCSIGVDNDIVVVAAERRLPGLDRAQFMEMLLNVASAADQFDNDLSQEFGAGMLGTEPAAEEP
ncbi:YbjN domain-containing protein [Synechococcus sp. BA-124 BA4]|jgi:hypothetical protein|uniref:YbjN domain-containing protein n=1 Tax=unclassified Synechococcus TaxID=2626047 RepID=UPI0018CF1DBF|nr:MULTISPECIES: YbjN domain-containing protein [unclassified Synechococcus]MEA5399357.1 YbjN domain-containing protein [Synechococcus sp. BA-124 BA4]QPN55385.1 YbjN domain-containing protein [Synechococcus sp. CBW1107]CAK6689351.1 hypothetical protein BBFGKLBO_00600 [Synechococcus sp. CBW1107]